MNIHKIGKVKIYEEIVEQVWLQNKWFVPINCKITNLDNSRLFEYTMYCDRFKELKDGDLIPFYTLTFKKIEKNEKIKEDFIVLVHVEEVKE